MEDKVEDAAEDEPAKKKKRLSLSLKNCSKRCLIQKFLKLGKVLFQIVHVDVIIGL